MRERLLRLGEPLQWSEVAAFLKRSRRLGCPGSDGIPFVAYAGLLRGPDLPLSQAVLQLLNSCSVFLQACRLRGMVRLEDIRSGSEAV